MTLSDNARGALYMNVSMLAFTVNDACMKAVTETLPLFQAIALRGVLTVAVLVMIALATGGLRLWPGGRDGRIIALRTLAEVGGTLTFLAALMHMPLANLSAVLQVSPLAVTLAAAVFFAEPVGWRRMIAIVVGFIGVTIIIRPGTSGFDIWAVIGLVSVACIVVRDLTTRRLSRGVPSITVAIWAGLGVMGMGLAGSAVEDWVPVTAHAAMLVAGASAFLIVGYLSIVMVMRVGEISFVAPFRYTALLWAILLGWLMFDTLPDGWTIVGATIVVATGIFTFYRERRMARAARVEAAVVAGPAVGALRP